jgi:RNase P protein component
MAIEQPMYKFILRLADSKGFLSVIIRSMQRQALRESVRRLKYRKKKSFEVVIILSESSYLSKEKNIVQENSYYKSR